MRCGRSIAFAASIAAAVAVASCDNDNSRHRMAAQQMDMVNMLSDSSGTCRLMALDNGDTLMLSKPAGNFATDTVTRYMVVYTTRKSVPYPTAVVSSMGPPVSAWLMRYSNIISDSVTTVTSWIGGGCLNLRLKVDDYGGAHYFGFAWLGWGSGADSARTAHIALYHNARSRKGYYSRTVSVCCPLSQISAALRSGKDSVALLTNEYGKGGTWHVMPY